MKKESQNIEYKRSRRDEYLKWICVFANAQGGTIFEHKNTIRNLTAAQKSILNYLKLYPKATQRELVENIENIGLGGIKYNLARLQQIGYLKRIGGKKNGYWEVRYND